MPERTVAWAVLSLGSNMGRREDTVLAALHLLDRHPGITLRRVSALYETEPVGEGFTGDFINAACTIETSLEPRGLLDACKAIERRYGRCAIEGSDDRTLDIDIVAYGDRVIEEQDLVVPHRAFRTRRFVLDPLCEIAPDYAVPPDGVSVRDIRARLGSSRRVRTISARSISG